MSATIEVQELAVQIKGEIIASNFDVFKGYLIGCIENMDYKLLNESDFEKAALDVKELNKLEKSLDLAEQEILKQLDDVYGLMQGIGEVREKSKACRLAKSKEIKQRRDELKVEIINKHIESIPESILLPKYRVAITDATKNKRSLVKMDEACASAVEDILARAENNLAKLEHFAEEHGKWLLPDIKELASQDPELVVKELELRLERHQADLAARKAKVEADKVAKAAQEEVKRQQAEMEAKAQQVAPANDPVPVESKPASKLATLPTSGKEKQDEMQVFLELVIAQLKPIRSAREQLQNETNRAKAEVFAADMTAAWKKLNA